MKKLKVGVVIIYALITILIMQPKILAKYILEKSILVAEISIEINKYE